MATTNVILHRTEKAAVDLRTKQFTLVKYNASGDLVTAGAGDRAFVLEDNPNVGEHGTIAIVGVAKCVAGGAINAGDFVASDGSGHVIAATSGVIVGQALHAAATSDLVELAVSQGH